MSLFKTYLEAKENEESFVYKVQDIKTKFFYTGIDIAKWKIDKYNPKDTNDKLYREIFQPKSGKIYLMISPVKKRIEEIKNRYNIDCQIVKFKLVQVS